MHETMLVLAVYEVIDETLLAFNSYILFQSFMLTSSEYQVKAIATLDSADCVNDERSSVD